ncbi:hypothetical protein H2204_015396 [Knufia peltigerae]|uniref:CAP-Gly domain-containing protein n=1 Tax=Knufia peltigerae TaxID=1002370 RepID=A0AA38XBQ6_9EURO|nr:hypothetical protein H2204_015396 [Knufia peltigerae]
MAGLSVGDTVLVPGDMHGTVKFIGPVTGKKGVFAGVQLATEYAPRGKNSGEVDGRFYFKTTIPGSGIFLPIEKAVKKTIGLGVRASPGAGTPTRLSSFNQGGRTPGTGIAKPNFSQSVGPGVRAGAASPALKPPARRESLPRPSSPLRKTVTPTGKALATPKTRPSGIGLGLGKSTNGGPGYRPSTGRPTTTFSQNLRHSTNTSSVGSGTSPSLGPESSFDEGSGEGDNTPTPTPHANRSVDVEQYEKKIRELNDELNVARRQLRDQGANFAEMESSFNELQKLLPNLEAGKRDGGDDEDDDLPRDVTELREIIREKNDKIKLLTAEFDVNRADFRSTIDTLEMASTETERVYEKRVDELLEEVRNLQDRSEDVESVAQQLKQLEELVQELEEGLEDARRGEAEARGEVEFLRGEVERSRSELRRERERLKTEEQLNGYSAGDVDDLKVQLGAKDDEIRGLKAIIQSLNEAHDKSPKINGSKPNGLTRKDKPSDEEDGEENRLSMRQQIRDLEMLLQQKSAHEEELANEVKHLRNSVALSKFPMPGSAFGLHTSIRSPPGGHSRENSEDMDRKHLSTGTTGSQRTVVLGRSSGPQGNAHDWQDSHRRSQSPLKHDQMDDGVTDISSSSAPLWCEICEESGHDILSCSNMFGPGKSNKAQGSLGKRSGKDVVREGLRRSGDQSQILSGADSDRPAPLVSRKHNNNSAGAASNVTSPPPTGTLPPPPPLQPVDDDKPPTPPAKDEPPVSSAAPGPSPAPAPAMIEGTGIQAGMLAGRTSGVIDPEKWCALCERDGHDSVDCPLEDAF